jgi:hypothetical protein
MMTIQPMIMPMTARFYCQDDDNNVVMTSNLSEGLWIDASSEAAPNDFDWSKRMMPPLSSSRAVSSPSRLPTIPVHGFGQQSV